MPTTAGEVLVTTGAQSAIHLLASVLLGRGDRVLVETPTYPHAVEDTFHRDWASRAREELQVPVLHLYSGTSQLG